MPIPRPGDRAGWNGLELEVVAMHAQRVEQIVVTTGGGETRDEGLGIRD